MAELSNEELNKGESGRGEYNKQNPASKDPCWYVVHTYSTYENKVKANIEKTIENRGLQDQIVEVSVPLQEVEEVRNGVRRKVQKKMFPGYVLIKMILNDDTWYVVRNTRGVTGFVGPGSKPVPLTEAELKAMMVTNDEVELDYEVGDIVTIAEGNPYGGQQGVVRNIDLNSNTVTVGIDTLGGETPVELGLLDVRTDNKK